RSTRRWPPSPRRCRYSNVHRAGRRRGRAGQGPRMSHQEAASTPAGRLLPMSELAWLDATAQAELVRRGEISPVDLAEAAIARIQLVNPEINAVVRPLVDDGRAAAGSLPGGAPFLLKDLLAAYAGAELSAGS